MDIVGFRIPANMVLSADPHIGNLDESLYYEPYSFYPKASFGVYTKCAA